MDALPAEETDRAIAVVKRLRTEDPSVAIGTTSWMAEIGTGVVHGANLERPAVAAPILELNRRMKDAFDRGGRLNPGVLPW